MRMSRGLKVLKQETKSPRRGSAPIPTAQAGDYVFTAGPRAAILIRIPKPADRPVGDSLLTEQSLLPDAPTLERLALSSSGFLFDPVSGHSFTLNETGIFVLQALQKNRDLRALRKQLLDEYDVDESILDRDLLEFLGSLRDQLLRS